MLFITQSGSYSCCFETFPQGKETVPHKKLNATKWYVKIKFYSKVSHNSTYVNVIPYVTVLKSYSNHCSCRFANFYNGGRNAWSLWVYLQIRSESWEGFPYLLRSHASLPPQSLNCAIQYLRRLSQDPPSQSNLSFHGVHLLY